MNVILINPPVLAAERKGGIGPVITNLFFNSPPLGLAYIAAVLEHKGVAVSLLDAPVERLTVGDTLRRIEEAHADVVGITATTNFFHSARELARRVKAKWPDRPVVIGGPHVSSNTEHCMAEESFDLGVVHEGEETFPELLEAIHDRSRWPQIQGLVYRDNGQLHTTEPRPPIEDLDALPFPARHMLQNELYVPQPNDENGLPKFAMITARGCPYQCIFCDKAAMGKRYRAMSAERLVDEVEMLIRDYGAKDIAFVDSTFTVIPERVYRVCDLIEQRGLKFTWTCTARANVVTKPMLERMARAGCWRIRLGVESGDDEVLAFIKKGITTDQVRRAAQWAAEVGMQPKGFFMVGHLVDTAESIERTIDFACSLPLKDVTVQINTPMMGTAQHKTYHEHGTLASERLEDMSYWEPSFIPKGMTEEQIIHLHRKFYRRFYLRPITVWRHLKHIRSLRDVVRYIKAATLLFHLLFSERLAKTAAGVNRPSANEP